MDARETLLAAFPRSNGAAAANRLAARSHPLFSTSELQMKFRAASVLLLATILVVGRAATVTLVIGSLGSSNTWSTGSLWDTSNAPGVNDDVIIGTCGLSGTACTSATGGSVVDLGSSLH